MEIITNKTFTGQTVVMDDKNYIGCTFVKCHIVYAGGDFSWVNSQFEECSTSFTGQAAKTIAFLQNVGVLPKVDGGMKNPPNTTDPLAGNDDGKVH
jgi:hypothetical protein